MTVHPLFNILRLSPLAVLIVGTAGTAAAQSPNTLLHSIPAPLTGVQTGAQFGSSVATDGAYTVAGAPYDDTGGSNSGLVKVFDSTTGALLFLLPNPLPAPSDFFGYAVAISGTRVAVGAWNDDTAALNAGSVYVYDLASGTPTVPIFTLNNPDPAIEDNFGVSVAMSGTRVVVGGYKVSPGATDAGSAYVYDLTSATPMVPVATLSNPGPPANDSFGISVAVSGDRVVVGACKDDTGAPEAGSAYVYNITSATPAVPVTELNNPGPAEGDRFGYAVAISGMRVVVGALRDGAGAIETGSAYVYDLGGGTPAVPVRTLNNPRPSDYDHFGYSVAISGMRLVIGAYHDDAGTTLAGSAYVYDLTSSTPTVPVTTLNNPGPAFLDNFGHSVAISGTRVVVGAVLDDTAASDAGSVYVYELSSGTPSVPVTTLNNPASPSAGDHFGISMAISGTLVVAGAEWDDTGANNAGSAFVYDLSSAAPTVPVFTLNNPGPAAFDHFGNSVAISGTRVVVGAIYDATGASGAGSAYVYDLSSATPTVPVVTLNNPGPAENDGFGCTVAISGSLVVVGAYRDDTGAGDAGSAYVYDLSSGTPAAPVATLNNPEPALNDYFGVSLAAFGTRVVVGADLDDTGAIDAGSVYVYDMTSATPTVPVATLNNPGPDFGDHFGHSVAISGTRVVAGAHFEETGASNAGSAYVYDLGSGTPNVPVWTLNNPGPARDDFFGVSVAISGTHVIVGTMRDDTGATDAGSAYVYELSSTTPAVPQVTLNNPGPWEGDHFGASVAISGTTVAIGTPYDDTVMGDKGAAYIFGPSPYDEDSDGLRDAWELTYWPDTAGHGPLDDFDHDGYNELLESALDLDPTISNPGGQPLVIDEEGYLTMTLTKQPGISYEVQSAGKLLPELPGSFSAASTTVLVNDGTTLKVRDNNLIGTAPARFMRVKVTAVP